MCLKLLCQIFYNVTMIDYDFVYDLKLIKNCLELSDEDLALRLNVSRQTINNWLNNKNKISPLAREMLYSIAYKRKLNINLLKTRLFEDDKENNTLLFHGSKTGINGDIDLRFSNPNSDFGQGFYLGENLKQAATWVSENPLGSVYCFYLDTKDLNIVKFDVNLQWIVSICYYRGYLNKYKNSKYLKELLNKIEAADVIIAPIADNIMYITMKDFSEGFISDEQCSHSLSANHLGQQYVLKSEKAIKQLKPVAKLYLCQDERDYYSQIKLEENHNGEEKSKLARRQYQGKGKYIDDIFKN